MTSVQARQSDGLLQDWSVNRGRLKVQLALLLFRTAGELRRGRRLGPLGAVLGAGVYRLVADGLLGIDIPTSTIIGPRLVLHHGAGVVITAAARIEADVVVHQGVTVGVTAAGGAAPVIRSGASLGPYAQVLGPVVVGRDASVGALALVVRDVPDGGSARAPRAVVAGPST